MSFIRIKKVHGREYRYEVEGFRENGKVKQRVLKYLGPVIPVKPDTPKWIFKKTSAIVQKKGMASISVSRKLKGQRVFIDYRYMLPDQS